MTDPHARYRPPETDPTGRQPSEPGAKLDAGKVRAGLLQDFGQALIAVAQVATFGAEKYSEGGWISVPDGQKRYRDALWRHLLAPEATDTDSGLLHAAHAAWNALAVLELHLRKTKT